MKRETVNILGLMGTYTVSVAYSLDFWVFITHFIPTNTIFSLLFFFFLAYKTAVGYNMPTCALTREGQLQVP